MKRPSDFEQAVIEIVEEGKAKDEEGHALYPVMEEPMVMAFFGAYNTLYETLSERPILVLNLIRTNKALEMFWGMFPGVWVKMIDHILEHEVNRRFADTYSFFAVANHRARKALMPLIGEINTTKCFNVKYSGDADFLKRSIFTTSPFNQPGKFLGCAIGEKEEKKYHVIYYDPITKLYIQLLQQIHYLQLYYGNNEKILRSIFPLDCLEEYIHWESVGLKIDCLDDCFVVDVTNGTKLLQQDLEKMKMCVTQICIYVRGTGIYTNDYPQIVNILYYETTALALRLLRILMSHFNGTVSIIQEAFKPLELNKELAKPYDVLLYDRDQGLYNTPDEQRTLLIAVLRHVAPSRAFGDSIVEEYGQATPLNCTVCHTETPYVDPLMMRAFCTMECRSSYTK